MQINNEYVRGCIYSENAGKPHKRRVAEVDYGGTRYHLRCKSRAESEAWLKYMKDKHADAYLKRCEECGCVFEQTSAWQRYCSKGCQELHQRAYRNKGSGAHVFRA